MFRFFAIDKYVDRLLDYLKARFGLIKLDLTRKVYKVVHLLLFLCVALFVLLTLLLLGHLCLALVLNEWLRTNYLGYLVAMGLQILWLVVVVLLFRSKKLYRLGENILLDTLFDEEIGVRKERQKEEEASLGAKEIHEVTEKPHEEDSHEEGTR